MKIKIAHEAPISVFHKVQRLTEIDYFLVHLFEENDAYFELAEESVEKGREVILDNSIFELGESFDPERYAQWIDHLRPTWYIIPDVLEDVVGTLEKFEHFKTNYVNQLSGKRIAVAQGKSLLELLYCFEKLHNDPVVDMIGISFDYSFYENSFVDRIYPKTKNLSTLQKWMLGRTYLLEVLNEFYIKGYFHKPVHLLGCALPQERGYHIIREYSWVYSIDTSNPVVAGYNLNTYKFNGLDTKSKTKLFTIINEKINDEQWNIMKYNIEMFRNFWTA